MQTLPLQNRMLSVIGAIEAGIALWYFTSGHWVNGMILAIAAASLIALYLHRERKVKGRSGRRRY